MNEFQRRICMTVAGVLLCGVCVAMFGFSAFGMDPFQSFAHGVWSLTPLGYGTFYMLLNALLLVFMFFFARRKIGLGTLINLFLLGYVAEYFTGLFASLFPQPSLLTRCLFLAAALVFMCFSSSLYFVADMGVSTYDFIALTLAEATPVPFQYLRIGTDLICVLTGFVLGQTIGIGTVLTAFFMGPVIAFFNRTVSEPLRYGRKKD